MNYIKQQIQALLCWLDYHNDWIDIGNCSWCAEREELKEYHTTKTMTPMQSEHPYISPCDSLKCLIEDWPNTPCQYRYPNTDKCRFKRIEHKYEKVWRKNPETQELYQITTIVNEIQ